MSPRVCLEIPTRDSSEVVEVYVDELVEEEVEGVCDLIASEEAPPTLYLTLLSSLFKTDRRTALNVIRMALNDCRQRSPSIAAELLGMQGALALLSGNVDEAAGLLNQAERMDGGAVGVWARKGLLFVHKGAYDAGELQFKAVLEKERESVAGRVGLALVAFKKGNVLNALDLFNTLMVNVPSLKRDCKMAMGSVYAAAGEYKEAIQLFEECLNHNERDYVACKCLGVCYVSSLEQLGPEAVVKGLKLLKRVYEEHDREDPDVLLPLADHFFFKKDYAKASALATIAASSPRQVTDQLRARALFILAKCAHSQGSWEEAFAKYLQCTKLDPQHAAGLYGLGQMYVRRKDLASGIKVLTEILALTLPNTLLADVYALLGCLCVQRYSEVGEIEFLERGAVYLLSLPESRLSPSIVKLALASVLETRDPLRAIKLYEELKDILKTSWQRMANLATLYLYANRGSEALAIVDEYTSDSEIMEDKNFIYLRARVREADYMESDPSKVEGIYKALGSLREATLQLGHYYISRSRYSEAMECFKEILGAAGEGALDVEGWYGLGVCHLRQRAYTPARKAFERILAQHDKHDLPSLSALCIVYVEVGRGEAGRGKYPAAEQCYKKALEFCGKALSLEPSNFVAANAAAVALAELNQLQPAKDAFIFLKTSIRSNNKRFMIDVLNNAGNALVDCGNYADALPVYQAALELLAEEDRHYMQLVLQWARAAYAAGKHSSNLNQYILAIEKLEAAVSGVHDGGMKEMMQYDIALCQQEGALTVMKTCASLPPAVAVSQLQEAIGLISQSICHFDALLDGQSTVIDSKTIENRSKYAVQLQVLLNKKLQETSHKEQSRVMQLENVQKERSKADLLLKQIEEEEREKLAQEQSAIEEQRRALAEQLKQSRIASAEDGSSAESSSSEKEVKRRKEKTSKRKTRADTESSPKKQHLSKDYISSDDESIGAVADADEDHMAVGGVEGTDEFDDLFQ